MRRPATASPASPCGARTPRPAANRAQGRDGQPRRVSTRTGANAVHLAPCGCTGAAKCAGRSIPGAGGASGGSGAGAGWPDQLVDEGGDGLAAAVGFVLVGRLAVVGRQIASDALLWSCLAPFIPE